MCKKHQQPSWQVVCFSQSEGMALNTLKNTPKFHRNVAEAKPSVQVLLPRGTWGWLSLAYNRPTWVTCRFHLAEWPSCHIPKDIGAGLAKWYGWVMGCRPHPDTLWRWGAAAKPWSLLTSPCGRSIFANMSPHELLSPITDMSDDSLCICQANSCDTNAIRMWVSIKEKIHHRFLVKKGSD